MIPKNIYQSWYTKDLDHITQNRIEHMKKLNPNWKYELHDNNDIDVFVNTHFKGEITKAYNRLNIIVAKVDFWRYLILYKYGGVYLDMDSSINKPLDSLIKDDDEAIITCESNPNTYVNWGLIFNKNHIILKLTIDLIIENIKRNTYPNDILRMTGPMVFSRAIDNIFYMLYKKPLIHRNITTNTNIMYDKNNVKFRIYGIDYNEYCTFKHKDCHILYENILYWRQEQREISLLK